MISLALSLVFAVIAMSLALAIRIFTLGLRLSVRLIAALIRLIKWGWQRHAARKMTATTLEG